MWNRHWRDLPLINTDDTDRKRLPKSPKLPKIAEIETQNLKTQNLPLIHADDTDLKNNPTESEKSRISYRGSTRINADQRLPKSPKLKTQSSTSFSLYASVVSFCSFPISVICVNQR
jgi:hypothetical protein